MAWDKDQPQNTTKIRNLPAVITPNWYAIEQADSSFTPYAINLLDRNVLNTSNPSFPVNPTAIANTYALFSKKDAAGIAQLYGIDTSSNILQFSGGTSSLISNQGSAFLPGGLMLKWGDISVAAYGSSTTVTYTQAFPNATLKVFITPSQNYSSIFPAYVASQTASQFTASKGNTSASLSSAFIWLALGY
jgi:hypothetical protein